MMPAPPDDFVLGRWCASGHCGRSQSRLYARLAEAVAALMAGRRVVGMGIMEFVPRSPADVSLARLVVDVIVGVR